MFMHNCSLCRRLTNSQFFTLTVFLDNIYKTLQAIEMEVDSRSVLGLPLRTLCLAVVQFTFFIL